MKIVTTVHDVFGIWSYVQPDNCIVTMTGEQHPYDPAKFWRSLQAMKATNRAAGFRFRLRQAFVGERDVFS